jgi:solute carrier family 35 protein C2
MVVQFCLTTLVLHFVPRFRPVADPHDPAFAHRLPSPAAGSERKGWWLWDPEKPVMTRWFYLTRIGPCGAATGLDIGLGNMSFRFITLTFYSASPFLMHVIN